MKRHAPLVVNLWCGAIKHFPNVFAIFFVMKPTCSTQQGLPCQFLFKIITEAKRRTSLVLSGWCDTGAEFVPKPGTCYICYWWHCGHFLHVCLITSYDAISLNITDTCTEIFAASETF